ncbi:hypothetical protein Mapa_003909 [Marchantia paleacea]|nr:hypothetical protein Mapa_003909 [Marchantia paleacea]
MTVKLYGDHLSQPVRAVALLLRANNIEYEFINMDVPAGEHKSPAYLAINPRGQVPALVDDDFTLTESATILRYMAVTRSVPDHWYPADVKERARVDLLMDWYQTNLRQTSLYVWHKELSVSVFKTCRSPEMEIKLYESHMQHALRQLEKMFLTEGGPFLLGACQPSIADALLSCEITQIQTLAMTEREKALGSKPKIKKWIEAMENRLAPHFADVHSRVQHVAELLDNSRNEIK